MTSWHCDDKEWMKQRRTEWREVQKKVNALRFLDKEWKPAVKHYYLTGEESGGDFCIKTLGFAPLIEMWFNPDDSSGNWERIRNKYKETSKWEYSKFRCYEVISGLGRLYFYKSNDSFFNGNEERLFDLFFQRGLKRECHSDKTDDEFKKYAWDKFRGRASHIFWSLYDDTCNPFNAINFQLDEWRDSFILSYDPERKELEWVVQLVDETLEAPDKFSSERYMLAVKVNAVLEDVTLPEAAKERIREFRARPCHPHCIDFEADDDEA